MFQDSRTKSQSVAVTAFQSVPADDRLTPAPSMLAGRLPSMDADMAQAIQLSLAGQSAITPTCSSLHQHECQEAGTSIYLSQQKLSGAAVYLY